jgi:hypothetical protein
MDSAKNMKIASKIIICAIISISIGIATATPLMVSELNIIPFPRVPQGIKADFQIDVIYANFDVQEHASNLVSGGLNLSIVNYNSVLNVTNNSNFPARISNINLLAAENASTIPSVSPVIAPTSGGGQSGVGYNGFVDGIWLDGNWLNVTWIPNGQWPTAFPTDRYPNVTETVPALPGNATTTGQWIEGVHIWETQHINTTDLGTTISTRDYAFLNGTWVDVTERIKIDNEQPFVLGINTLLQKTLTFDTNYSNKTQFDEAQSQRDSEWTSTIIDVWAGKDGFDNYWQPHESRLIYLNGTVNVGVNAGLESLANGKITLYASASSYVKDTKDMQTNFTNTASTVTELKQVQVTKTTSGFLYNTILNDAQTFKLDSYGLEASIAPRS